MNLVELDTALRKLRLSGMAATLDARLRHAQSERQTPIPAYLGAESQEALRDIERITSSGKALGYLIVLGTAVNLATSTPAETLATQSHDVTPQAQALTGIPVIVQSPALLLIPPMTRRAAPMRERPRNAPAAAPSTPGR